MLIQSQSASQTLVDYVVVFRRAPKRYFVVTWTASKNELPRRGNQVSAGKEYNWVYCVRPFPRNDI